MCEINGLSGLYGGWTGTLKDTSNEYSSIVCSNTTDRNILSQLLPLSFFLSCNGCKTNKNSPNAVFHLGRTPTANLPFLWNRCKVRKIQKQSKEPDFIFFMIAAYNHEIEVSFSLHFTQCSKRPVVKNWPQAEKGECSN